MENKNVIILSAVSFSTLKFTLSCLIIDNKVNLVSASSVIRRSSTRNKQMLLLNSSYNEFENKNLKNGSDYLHSCQQTNTESKYFRVSLLTYWSYIPSWVLMHYRWWQKELWRRCWNLNSILFSPIQKRINFCLRLLKSTLVISMYVIYYSHNVCSWTAICLYSWSSSYFMLSVWGRKMLYNIYNMHILGKENMKVQKT